MEYSVCIFTHGRGEGDYSSQNNLNPKVVKKNYLLKFVADESEGFINVVLVPCDGYNAFRTAAITDIYLCTALQQQH